MIILDTNVLSALAGQTPRANVVSWLDSQPPESIWITSITVFEARLGIETSAKGRRRQRLETRFEEFLRLDIKNRVLEFDAMAATVAARLAAEHQRAGRPVDFRDTQIAGIAMARKATLATRNVRHFQGLAITVVNPWDV